MVFLSHFLLFLVCPKRIWIVTFYSAHISDAMTACLIFSDGAGNYITASYTLSLWLNLWPCSPVGRLHFKFRGNSRSHPACDGFTLKELKVHCPLWQWGELWYPGAELCSCCLLSPLWEHLCDRFSGSALSQSRIRTGTCFALTAVLLVSALTSAAWLLKNASFIFSLPNGISFKKLSSHALT